MRNYLPLEMDVETASATGLADGYDVINKFGRNIDVDTSSVDVNLWIRNFGLAPRLRRPTGFAFGNELDDSIYGGLEVPEKTDIHLRITQASANNLDVVGGYDLLLIPN